VIRLVRSEAVKVLATRRTLGGFVLAVLALAALGTVATVQPATRHDVVDISGTVHDVLSDGAGSAVFVVLILGALVATWEYQHRIMTHTLLAAPWRERVVGAKAVVALALGALLGAVAIGLALAITVPWLGSSAVDELARADLWVRIGRVLVATALWCALGAGIGALIANQVGAIVTMLLWFLVAEPIIGGLLEGVGPYLPGRAVQSLLGNGNDVLSTPGGLLLTVGYVAAFTVAGVLATQRRDIA
jgi:hypothetical protein